MRASALTLAILLLCGCAVAQPVQTPAASSAPLAVARPAVTVVSGARQRIDFISTVNPDCTSAGYVTVHVITPPVHGELATEQGFDYPAYPKDNQRYQCNLKKVPLINIYYKSSPGYTGPDTATIEWVSPVIPVAKTSIYTITVQ